MCTLLVHVYTVTTLSECVRLFKFTQFTLFLHFYLNIYDISNVKECIWL